MRPGLLPQQQSPVLPMAALAVRVGLYPRPMRASLSGEQGDLSKGKTIIILAKKVAEQQLHLACLVGRSRVCHSGFPVPVTCWSSLGLCHSLRSGAKGPHSSSPSAYLSCLLPSGLHLASAVTQIPYDPKGRACCLGSGLKPARAGPERAGVHPQPHSTGRKAVQVQFALCHTGSRRAFGPGTRGSDRWHMHLTAARAASQGHRPAR